MPQRLLSFLFILPALGVILSAPSVATASPSPQGTATVASSATPTFDIARLDPPATVIPPSQVDEGAQYYWSMCMGCHGDRGQGLTPAWQDSYGEDRDCWESGCHGPNTTSFEFKPETPVPALVGPGKLARFSNAFELYSYILENMPWWNPSSVTPKEAWSVTAYLLKLNGAQALDITLSLTNGSAIPVHRTIKSPGSEIPGTLILVGVLILAAIGMALQVVPKLGESTTIRPKPNFVHHLHPPSIPALQARFRYTLGAGGLAVFLALILLVTGLLEMYFYIPTPEHAAISVETITTLVPFGNLIRNLHYWSAQMLVIVMTVHLLRVILTGAYAPPRHFNYLLGLGLLVVILLLNFTGYILRWDEGIRWALVVGTNLLKSIPWIGEGVYRFIIGGNEVGAASLTRFYAWHIFGLTIGGAILIGWHAFRVRRDGGIAVPPPTERKENQRITRFALVRREVFAMLVAGVLLMLFAMLIPAPIAQPISVGSVKMSDSQAPWFFLWVQQLLKYGDPFLWGVLTPILIVIVLGLLPYVLPNAKPENLGRWFPRGNRIAQVFGVLVIVVIFVLIILGALKL
jgi:quinol-cytochrome oxidoreductase complex cytochrome b subunit/mono/diheme cytochrome c family protein